MELQIFKNAELGSVRSTMINGEPYFVGKDVVEILGYKDTSDASLICYPRLQSLMLHLCTKSKQMRYGVR